MRFVTLTTACAAFCFSFIAQQATAGCEQPSTPVDSHSIEVCPSRPGLYAVQTYFIEHEGMGFGAVNKLRWSTWKWGWTTPNQTCFIAKTPFQRNDSRRRIRVIKIYPRDPVHYSSGGAEAKTDRCSPTEMQQATLSAWRDKIHIKFD